MAKALETFIKNQIEKSLEIKQKMLADNKLILLIEEVARKCIEVYKNGNKVLVAGNGGSAADAQHITSEFVGRFHFDRPGVPSIALTTDTSILTAIGNDYGYEKIFARQIQAIGRKGDMFIGISTSGNSENIIEALKECGNRGIIRVGLTGESGGRMAQLCDYCIKIQSNETPRVQEAHILVGHIICSAVEEEMFGRGFKG